MYIQVHISIESPLEYNQGQMPLKVSYDPLNQIELGFPLFPLGVNLWRHILDKMAKTAWKLQKINILEAKQWGGIEGDKPTFQAVETLLGVTEICSLCWNIVLEDLFLLSPLCDRGDWSEELSQNFLNHLSHYRIPQLQWLISFLEELFLCCHNYISFL